GEALGGAVLDPARGELGGERDCAKGARAQRRREAGHDVGRRVQESDAQSTGERLRGARDVEMTLWILGRERAERRLEERAVRIVLEDAEVEGSGHARELRAALG